MLVITTFDTATVYKTEKSLREAIKEAMKLEGRLLNTYLINMIPEMMISSSDGPRPIPVIGMGTATLTAGSDEVKAAILEAIKVGYRHFDTAAFYQTENSVGEAIKEALRQGLIKSRTELFITTKLWCNSAERHLVLPALKESLRNLGLEYVDLYLIHWPLKLNQEQYKLPVPKECVAAIDIKGVWEAMEDCQDLKLTKSIGVSNFSCRRIQEILSFARIPPSVNQVEMNPLWQQNELNRFCKANSILLTAYSPLGGYGNPWGHNRVMESDVLQQIAMSKGKTIAQVSLRWLYEQGVSFVVKSFNMERMKQNLDIFDWSLSQEELNKISRIPQRKNLYLVGMMVKEHNDVMDEIDAEI
ncbi:D-galacturonate reductase-like [Cynara cardunculus var. scolymus]|uniref:D-galacturonate reductase-like n=1 Tax=Cynara cardunculus var. scolymus TaxID=59895 RepID=UPI000D629E3B|nr:D-galacturonate reductase-like [Cynara cardunculus var. scolymus]